MLERTCTLLLLVSFLTLPLVGCQSGASEAENRRNRLKKGKQENRTSVETIEVRRETIQKKIKSYGNVSAQELVTITPQVSNRITDIYVDLGDTVKQDQLLARIQDDTYQQQVQQNRAQLQQQKAVFKRDSIQYFRQRKLYQKDLISDSEYETAQSNYQSSKAQFLAAKAALEQNQENLNNTKVQSPVYGVVLNRSVSEGDVVSSGQAMFELANLTGLETRVHLPMHEWEQVRIGQKVELATSNNPGFTAMGRIARKSPRINPTTGLGEVVISITSRHTPLHQGALVESAIIVDTHNQVPVIPRAALVENVETFIEPENNSIELRRTYSVFVIQGDTLAQRQPVELGIDQGNSVEITKGLSGNEEIVITGQNNLTNGRKVKVVSPEQLDSVSTEMDADTTNRFSRSNRTK